MHMHMRMHIIMDIIAAAYFFIVLSPFAVVGIMISAHDRLVNTYYCFYIVFYGWKFFFGKNRSYFHL